MSVLSGRPDSEREEVNKEWLKVVESPARARSRRRARRWHPTDHPSLPSHRPGRRSVRADRSAVDSVNAAWQGGPGHVRRPASLCMSLARRVIPAASDAVLDLLLAGPLTQNAHSSRIPTGQGPALNGSCKRNLLRKRSRSRALSAPVCLVSPARCRIPHRYLLRTHGDPACSPAIDLLTLGLEPAGARMSPLLDSEALHGPLTLRPARPSLQA